MRTGAQQRAPGRVRQRRRRLPVQGFGRLLGALSVLVTQTKRVKRMKEYAVVTIMPIGAAAALLLGHARSAS